VLPSGTDERESTPTVSAAVLTAADKVVKSKLLFALQEAAYDVVDGARSRHRSAIGWLRRNAPH